MKLQHVTISVKNFEESLRFYQEVLGCPINRQFSTPDSQIAFLGDGETEIELIGHHTHTDVWIGADISLGFEVDSLQETMELLQSRGIDYQIVSINPQLRFVFAADPNGVKLQFLEHAR